MSAMLICAQAVLISTTIAKIVIPQYSPFFCCNVRRMFVSPISNKWPGRAANSPRAGV